MFKLQNFKSRHFLGIILIFGLLFYGCRQKEILPETPPLTSQLHPLVQQAKAWYAHQNGQKILSDTMTREPDWQNVAIQSVADSLGQITYFLEMPLLYNGKYEKLKQNYPNGKKGRGFTKVIMKKIAENDFQPIVMRFFADSAYLAGNYPPLLQNTFTQLTAGFTGEVLFYDWEKENFMTGNRFANGVLSEIALQGNGDAYQQKIECIILLG
jgi:hypothetical protein